MKKLFFAVIIAALTITSLNAQTFGVKAGANLSNYSYNGGDYDDELNDAQKSLFGFHIGGFAEFEISDQFAFQPELLFTMQGTKFEESGEEYGVSYSSEYTSKQSYINIPLMAKYYVAEGFNIQAGPQIGFLMSSKYEGTFTVGGNTEFQKTQKMI